MKQDTADSSRWYADDGKFFRRKSDHNIAGTLLVLREVTMINGVRLPLPHLETIEDYEEIDDSVIEAEQAHCREIERQKEMNDALEAARAEKLAALEDFDSSSSVNSFLYGGASLWIDRSTRISLMNSTTIQKAAGISTTTIWFGEIHMDMACDALIQLLGGIELYALECYNVTSRHKAAILSLGSVEAIRAYDYRTGYPDKISISL